MTPATVERLLQLNRDFYQTIATDFHETRGGLPVGWRELAPWIVEQKQRPLRVLDVGCGNGRFAWLLDEWAVDIEYVGVDADEQLLALAANKATTLSHLQCTFSLADFTASEWYADVQLSPASFDIVVCFAALHHVPSKELRQQVVHTLAKLAANDGVVILSHWQFLSSIRFVRKQIAWHTIGLSEENVEPGDALLPWHQGAYAVRYVHQTNLDEAVALGQSADLQLLHHFYADGKEGNLNLYTIYQHHRHGAETSVL